MWWEKLVELWTCETFMKASMWRYIIIWVIIASFFFLLVRCRETDAKLYLLKGHIELKLCKTFWWHELSHLNMHRSTCRHSEASAVITGHSFVVWPFNFPCCAKGERLCSALDLLSRTSARLCCVSRIPFFMCLNNTSNIWWMVPEKPRGLQISYNVIPLTVISLRDPVQGTISKFQENMVPRLKNL